MAVLSINSNIPSLRAQRSLLNASESVASSYARLSSGLRINSASDDPAGLSVAVALTASAQQQSVAGRNINDGVSALNIVDGALSSQVEILGRLQELATQAANGTLSSKQRQSLQTEYLSLVQEFGRIGETTTFNKVSLLKSGNGTNSSALNIQAGTDGSSNSNLQIQLNNTGLISGTIYALSDPGADMALAPYIDTMGGILNAHQNRVIRTQFTDSGGQTQQALVGVFGTNGEIQLTIYINAASSNGMSGTNPDDWVTGATYVGAYNQNTGKSDNVAVTSILGLANGKTGSLTVDLRSLYIKPAGDLYEGVASSIDFTGVETQATARHAVVVAKARQDELVAYRGAVGAAQSRLATASSVLATTRENYLAAASRIQDVDVASESSALVAAQIRQQAATSVLAQANSQPKLVLALLQNS